MPVLPVVPVAPVPVPVPEVAVVVPPEGVPVAAPPAVLLPGVLLPPATATGASPMTPPFVLLSVGAESVRLAALVWRTAPRSLWKSPVAPRTTLWACKVPPVPFRLLAKSPWVAVATSVVPAVTVPLLAMAAADSLAWSLA